MFCVSMALGGTGYQHSLANLFYWTFMQHILGVELGMRGRSVVIPRKRQQNGIESLLLYDFTSFHSVLIQQYLFLNVFSWTFDHGSFPFRRYLKNTPTVFRFRFFWLIWERVVVLGIMASSTVEGGGEKKMGYRRDESG